MRQFTLMLWSCITIIMLSGNFPAAAGGNPELLIVPGVGVGQIQIGTKSGRAARKEGIEIETVGRGSDIIGKIKVSDKRYNIQYNDLRVGDELQKIFRFYQNFTKEARGKDLLIIRDPGQGVEFLVDMKTERIMEIGIFEPEVPDYYKRKSQRSEAVKHGMETKSEKASMRNYYKENVK